MKTPKLLRSAFVIARRDFTATVMSKTFLLFLLGPLFPLAVGLGFGGLGDTIRSNVAQPVVAVVASQADYRALYDARKVMEPLLIGAPAVVLSPVTPAGDVVTQRRALLAQEDPPVLGVLDGGLEAPHFTGAVNADGQTVRQLSFMIDQARRARAAPAPVVGQPLEVQLTQSSSGSLVAARSITARIGQGVLFILTILLAGMLLSQLIEEKSNKAIEVIAAAIPIESIFIGKLFAMLGMAWVGILVWTAAGAGAIAFYLPGGLSALPAPAVGWPVFITLGVIYFSMSYLLIGSLFLGIGSQASTVREVQTLSMPVTMAQMMIFALATVGVGHPDSASAIAGAVFPLSSPFAMFGRAAELPVLAPPRRRAGLADPVGHADPPPQRPPVPPKRPQERPGVPLAVAEEGGGLDCERPDELRHEQVASMSSIASWRTRRRRSCHTIRYFASGIGFALRTWPTEASKMTARGLGRSQMDLRQWFQQILAAALDQYGTTLKLSPATRTAADVPPDIRKLRFRAGRQPIAAFAASVSCAISALCGKGPWLMRATPAAAHSAFGGAPGKAIAFNGNGTSRTTRSMWRGSAIRGTKNPLAPASAKALPRSITSSITLSSIDAALISKSVRALRKKSSPTAARIAAMRRT